MLIAVILYVNDSANTKKIYESNINTLTDSIKITKNKANEIQFEKNVLISDVKGLKSLNITLYDEVKLQNSKVVSLSKVNASIRFKNDELNKLLKSKKDTIIVKNDSTFTLKSELEYIYDENNYDIFTFSNDIVLKDGQIHSFEGYLSERNSKMDISIGHTLNKGYISLYLNTKYPLKVDEIESFIDINNKAFRKYQKKKKFSVGIGIGYDVKGNVLPQIGIYYSIFRF